MIYHNTATAAPARTLLGLWLVCVLVATSVSAALAGDCAETDALGTARVIAISPAFCLELARSSIPRPCLYATTKWYLASTMVRSRHRRPLFSMRWQRNAWASRPFFARPRTARVR